MLFSLEGGLAVGEVPMRAQPQNEHWIDVCFGQDTVAALAEAPISCAGERNAARWVVPCSSVCTLVVQFEKGGGSRHAVRGVCWRV